MRASALRPNPISCIMWNTILDEKGRGGWEEKPRTDQESLCGDGVCCESSVDSVVRHIVDSDRIERSLAHMALRPVSTSIRTIPVLVLVLRCT